MIVREKWLEGKKQWIKIALFLSRNWTIDDSLILYSIKPFSLPSPDYYNSYYLWDQSGHQPVPRNRSRDGLLRAPIARSPAILVAIRWLNREEETRDKNKEKNERKRGGGRESKKKRERKEKVKEIEVILISGSPSKWKRRWKYSIYSQ